MIFEFFLNNIKEYIRISVNLINCGLLLKEDIEKTAF